MLLFFYTVDDTCFHFRGQSSAVMWSQDEGLIKQMCSNGKAIYLFQNEFFLFAFILKYAPSYMINTSCVATAAALILPCCCYATHFQMLTHPGCQFLQLDST